MGLLASLFAGTPNPSDDFWYHPVGTLTDAGVRVDATSAQKISAWYRGRDILATVLAMLPLHLMQRLPNDGGARLARNHPLFDVLHDKSGAIQQTYQTTGVPESFLLNREGVIVKRVIGAHDWNSDANRALVERMLGEPGK